QILGNALRRLLIRIRGTIPVPMKRRVLVFSSCLFPVRWRRSRARCCEECGARPPARAELSAEGGGLKSKRLRPPAAHGRFLTTPTALFSKAHGLPGG